MTIRKHTKLELREYSWRHILKPWVGLRRPHTEEDLTKGILSNLMSHL